MRRRAKSESLYLAELCCFPVQCLTYVSSVIARNRPQQNSHHHSFLNCDKPRKINVTPPSPQKKKERKKERKKEVTSKNNVKPQQEHQQKEHVTVRSIFTII